MPLLQMKDARYYPGENGQIYKSVTTILKCISPFQGVRAAILEEASDIGKQSHAVVARLAEGEAIDKEEWYALDQQVRNAALAYDRYRTKIHLYTQATELEIINEEYGYGCTIDHIGPIPKGLIINDWKTGEIHHITVFQLAAYYKAAIKLYPKLIGACAVQLGKKDGRPHPYYLSADQLEYYFKGFLAMKTMSDQMDEAKLFIEGGTSWKQD